MTSRADMVRKGTAALADVNADFEPYRDGTPDGNAVDYATAVLDAVLPQVSTVAELEALPVGTLLVSPVGELVNVLDWDGSKRYHSLDGLTVGWAEAAMDRWGSFGPLTVVWQP